MFCGNCGNQLPEGANVCPKCGTKVAKEVDFSDVKDYAGYKVQQAASNVQVQVQNARQPYNKQFESRKVRDVHDMFIDPGEEVRAVIGGGYLDNFMKAGTVSKGFGVLTNFRLYYRGKCFSKGGSFYTKTDEDRIVDISDITSSGFVYTRYMFFLILSIVFGTLSLLALIASFYIFMLAFPVFIVSILLYTLFRPIMYIVTFAGGSLSIQVSSNNIKEVRAFDKTLHQIKDKYLARR